MFSNYSNESSLCSDVIQLEGSFGKEGGQVAAICGCLLCDGGPAGGYEEVVRWWISLSLMCKVWLDPPYP